MRITLILAGALVLSAPAGMRSLTTAPESEAVQVRWGSSILQQPRDWYGSAEARRIAASVLEYQSPEGGWPKNTDMTAPPASADARAAAHRGPDANTIDNDATTTPIRFLALVHDRTGDPRYRASVERGLDYLLAAQYPNGGWPQYFPLRHGYYSRITYNDDAMVNVLELLRDARDPQAPFAFLDGGRRGRAADAVTRGIDLILRTQVVQDGRLTVWCAQHDETTLEPAWGRAYEPPTLSGNESVGIVRFLMSIEEPTPEIVAAIEGAVAWLRAVAIAGLRLEEVRDAKGNRDRRVVADPAAPALWARFYDLDTNRPVFMGRDSVPRAALADIEQERRIGYAYYGTWPARLLAEDYPRWRETLNRGERPAPE
jgi:PelA/Pel-15E family pectate lyase